MGWIFLAVAIILIGRVLHSKASSALIGDSYSVWASKGDHSEGTQYYKTKKGFHEGGDAVKGIHGKAYFVGKCHPQAMIDDDTKVEDLPEL